MPASAPPRTRSGGNTSPGRAASVRPSTVAPIRRSGSATRRIGRRVSEASPNSSRLERPPREQAHQQADGRPRVAAVERARPPRRARRSRRRERAPRRRRARCRRPARAAPPPSTGCRRPVRARAPRRPRPRARRTAAPGARSTCRRAPGRSRAGVRIAGPSASRRHRCFTITSRVRYHVARAAASIVPILAPRGAACALRDAAAPRAASRPAPRACPRRCAGGT